jgi:hypothetical protein
MPSQTFPASTAASTDDMCPVGKTRPAPAVALHARLADSPGPGGRGAAVVIRWPCRRARTKQRARTKTALVRMNLVFVPMLFYLVSLSSCLASWRWLLRETRCPPMRNAVVWLVTVVLQACWPAIPLVSKGPELLRYLLISFKFDISGSLQIVIHSGHAWDLCPHDGPHQSFLSLTHSAHYSASASVSTFKAYRARLYRQSVP